jgi:peptidyl-dipeptidase A
LLDSSYEDSYENDINSLFHMALERVAFLPFGLLIDKWRWDLFSGKTPESEWNKHWWELREKYQKIRAPTPRGEEFFDPGAKYHIPADSQYIAYFVAHILQFSFYKGLCIAADQYNPNNATSEPLHKCDYYENRDAGDKLRRGLELGMSEHWGVALNELTGSDEMSSSALVEYFKPLYDFLKEENRKTRIQRMSSMLDEYEIEGSEMCNKLVNADWEVATDTDNEKAKDVYAQTVLENQKFTQSWYDSTFKDANPDDFSDKLVKRQLKYLTKLGRDALDPTDLTELTRTITAMTNIYDKAEICPFDKQDCTADTDKLPLEPELQDIMGTSDNYDELLWTWTQWREKSGKLMRTEYKKYLELNQKTAELNSKQHYFFDQLQICIKFSI